MSRVVMTTVKTFAYGASRMTFHYASALTAAGHDVTVLYEQGSDASSKNGSILPEMADAGVATTQVPGMRRAAVPGCGGALKAAVTACRPDIVVSTQLGDAPATTKAARGLGVPCVLFAQNMPRFTGPGPVIALKNWVYGRAVGRASRSLCVAPAIRTRMIEEGWADPAAVDVVLNGLDMDRLPPMDASHRESVRREFGLADGERLLVNLARIHPQKGLDTLAEAAALMRADADCPPFKILIVGDVSGPGDQPHKDALVAQLDRLGLRETVLLPGFRSDGPRLLQAADLYVLSSRWEGLPLVILEAMAARLPVVTTEYGERFAGFEDGVHGWYTPVEDAEAFARTTAAALKLSDDERRNVGEAGRRYLEENLTLDEGKRQFVAEVESLIRGADR